MFCLFMIFYLIFTFFSNFRSPTNLCMPFYQALPFPQNYVMKKNCRLRLSPDDLLNLGERVEGLAGGRGKDKFQKSFKGEKYAFPVTEFEVRDSS